MTNVISPINTIKEMDTLKPMELGGVHSLYLHQLINITCTYACT